MEFTQQMKDNIISVITIIDKNTNKDDIERFNKGSTEISNILRKIELNFGLHEMLDVFIQIFGRLWRYPIIDVDMIQKFKAIGFILI